MKVFLSLLVFLIATVTFAQNDQLISVKFDGISKEATTPSEAVREISAQATESTARSQVIEMIGEAKYRKNKQLIDSKIISQSSKFIPTINPGQAKQAGDAYKVSVELKVSQDSLRKLVQAAGLLADTETPGTLISLVSFANKSSDLTYKWWAPETAEGKKDLAELNRLWQLAITTDLEKKNFKVAKAAKQSFDEQELAASAQSQMMIKGEARVRTAEDGSGTFAMKVGVYQTADSRLIADITRSTKLAKVSEAAVKTAATQMFSEISRDLTTSVHEAWQTGVIGSSLVQIAAVGALTPKQLEDFKLELSRSLRDLKNLKERRFSSGRVVLEGDFKGSVASLGARLKQTQLPSFQTEVEGFDNTQIELKVKARR